MRNTEREGSVDAEPDAIQSAVNEFFSVARNIQIKKKERRRAHIRRDFGRLQWAERTADIFSYETHQAYDACFAF